MRTNSIGAGKKNRSVTLWEEEVKLYGRSYSRLGYNSVQDFMRDLLQRGAEFKFPDVAKEIKAIRNSKAAHQSAAIFGALVGLVLVLAATFAGGKEMIRARASIRPVRIVRFQRRKEA